VRLGTLVAAPVRVGPPTPALDREIEACARELVAVHAGRAPSDIPALAPARELYRTFGVDPTRTRPSSEALLRRVLAGKPLPRISDAVDLGNLLALRFLLPIGLYDADAIAGDVRLARGGPGTEYAGARKERVHLDGRPALFDDLGPFGNPTADSARTAVRTETRRLWMVVFAPASVPRDVMQRDLDRAEHAFRRHLSEPTTEIVTGIEG
jgi:DNA/RNA-binding domain of Phe-tRNA-synthetase-like protein